MPKADEYPTCKRTYATLRIYHKSDSPEYVSRTLALKPSDRQISGAKNPESKDYRRFQLSGWFLSSQGKIHSRDLRLHLDWLLDRIEEKQSEFERLRSDGWWMDISCFWLSRRGHGGPTLGAGQMAKLGSLGIEIWFDVYFSNAPVLDANDNPVHQAG